MEVARRAAQQEVDQSDLFGVGETLYFVECEQARHAIVLDRAHQQAHPIAHGMFRSIACCRVVAHRGTQHGNVQSSAFQGMPDVRGRDVERICSVQPEPSSEYAARPFTPTDIGEQSSLAEPARRMKHSDPPVERLASAEQLRSAQVTIDPLRNRHSGSQ